MDILGKTMMALDRHFHTADDPQEFSERLFYNIGRLYTFGLVCGAVRGLCHPQKAANKTHLLDSIANHAWHTSITWAKAAYIYTPTETLLRLKAKCPTKYSHDAAWGFAWGTAIPRATLTRRLLVGTVAGSGHHLISQHGPTVKKAIAEGASIARVWRWRMHYIQPLAEFGRKVLSRSPTVEVPDPLPLELSESLQP